MKLSTTEILIMEQIANGNKTVKSLALALNKSNKQIYITLKKLSEKGIIGQIKNGIRPNKTTHIAILLRQVAKTRNLAPVLSDSGIPIFTALLNPMTIEDLIKETGFKKTIIYKKLEEAKKRSLVKKRVSTFQINEKVWPELKDFLEELKRYESAIDGRIPLSSIIYHRKKESIVFSCKEEVDAAKTAFSAYEQYGIKLLTVTDYYYLPKKKLTKKEILKHSLYIVEKERSIANLIYLALFYAKFRKEFKIKHKILEDLSAVLEGEKIGGYPSYQEIKDRAEIYKIKV